MAKPGRVYWKGTLRLSLVTIAVEMMMGGVLQFWNAHKP